MGADLSAIIIPLLVVFVFAIVQSIVGVGLLVFGTPTLILLGYGFEQTLAIVLPASLCVSAIQVSEGSAAATDFRRTFNIFCAPAVLLGAVVAYSWGGPDLKLLIAGMLLLSACIRVVAPLQRLLDRLIKRRRRGWLLGMGAVHGLTNMGGGLLTLYSSSVHDGRKVPTRAGIAYGYVVMGTTQYVTLLIAAPALLTWHTLAHAAAAALVYMTIGRRLFRALRQAHFEHLITGILTFYGVLMLL